MESTPEILWTIGKHNIETICWIEIFGGGGGGGG